MTLTFDLDLEKFTQGQIFWNINLGKLAKICLDIMHRASSIVGEVKGQGQGWAKGQIHLITYNFTSNCHRDFKHVHILVYEKPHQIWPWPWPLALTSSPKVKIFETSINEN